MNDSLETQVVKLALGEEAARRAYISSTKSMTGHCLGAVYAIEGGGLPEGPGGGHPAPHHPPGGARPRL